VTLLVVRRRLQGPRVEIENQDVLAHRLRVSRIRRQSHEGAVVQFVKDWRVGRDFDLRVEQADDLMDRDGCGLVARQGPTWPLAILPCR
jgi:hypothetical protein